MFWGQIDANDMASVSFEERSNGTGRGPKFEHGGVVLSLKQLEESVALHRLPRWCGSHIALIDLAVIGVAKDARRIVSHLSATC
jgi:hypothetical protein